MNHRTTFDIPLVAAYSAIVVALMLSRRLAVCTIDMSVEPPEGKTGRFLLANIGPFVAENHVIVLTPPEGSASQTKLHGMTRVLNSSETTALYDRICGTASVSVKTLLGLKLPETCT
jgi:hypothetical protein